MKFAVFNTDAKEVSNIDVSDSLFVDKVNEHLLYLSVKAYLAAKRSGSANTKTRSEVKGGNAKPWKQKGTGRARMGTLKTPLRRGGGVIFGPKPRKYNINLTKKMKKAALKSALTAKKENIVIMENLELKEAKTKVIVNMLNNFKINGDKALFIDASENLGFKRASNNVKSVEFIQTTALNTYRLIKNKKVFLTVSAVKKLEEAIKVGK